MEDIALDLSSKQMSRLRNGHTIQVKPGMVGSGMPMKLHPAKVRKLHSAARRQKGCRLDMTPEEFAASGMSWKGFKRGVAKAAKTTGKAIKAGYKGYKEYLYPTLAPVVRKGLQSGARALGTAAAAVTGQPGLAAIGEIIADKTIPYIGDKTGAFGAKGGRLTLDKAAMRAMTGMGARGKKKFNTNMVDTGLPADRPLVDIGNLQYGQDFIRGVGYGVMVAGRLYP